MAVKTPGTQQKGRKLPIFIAKGRNKENTKFIPSIFFVISAFRIFVINNSEPLFGPAPVVVFAGLGDVQVEIYVVLVAIASGDPIADYMGK